MWPDADGEYDRPVDCLWTIVAPEDRRIEFEVTRMDIQHQRVCFHNYIAVICFAANILQLSLLVWEVSPI